MRTLRLAASTRPSRGSVNRSSEQGAPELPASRGRPQESVVALVREALVEEPSSELASGERGNDAAATSGELGRGKAARGLDVDAPGAPGAARSTAAGTVRA
jgi:hypothetical protein